MSTQFSSIWLIDRTLSGATTPGQSGLVSDGNGGLLRIPQSPSITGASPSDCLVLYLGHSLGKSYHSADMTRSSQVGLILIAESGLKVSYIY